MLKKAFEELFEKIGNMRFKNEKRIQKKMKFWTVFKKEQLIIKNIIHNISSHF